MKKSQSRQKKSWGFNTRSMDTSVRPQDDFYHFANGNWIKKNKIPPEESRWGSFITLRYNTERQLKAIVEELLAKKKLKNGSPEQLVSDLYRSALDLKTRNSLGPKPIEPLCKEIQSLSSLPELLHIVARLHRTVSSPLWATYLDQDPRNSNKYLLGLAQGGLGLPDRDYYLLDAPEQKRVREAYVVHIKNLLKLFGKKESEITRDAQIIMRLETALAKVSMTKEDARDVDKTTNRRTVGTWSKEVPQIDWKNYFSLLGAEVKEINVAQPEFLAKMAKMLKSEPLEDWKIYIEWHLLNDAASLLSQKYIEENFNFYGKVMTGTKKIRAPWRRALSAVNGSVGEALGKLYVKRHFPPAAKKEIDTLVSDLFDAYEDRLRKIDWMSKPTKHKAIRKLRAMNRKIGYPTRFRDYKGLKIRPDDYFGNILRSAMCEHRRAMKRLRKPVDRKEWFMTPQTVNAYCHFNLNEIVFPAAILQPPFFDFTADDAVNYAGIGSVIGHEITHGFDDQGSKFDHRGNLKSWWTTKDRKRFEKKAEILVKQFDVCEVIDGVYANGKLTLGENIADLGGLAIAWDAYQLHLHKTGRKNIDGYTPEERFFFGFAQQEREIARKEFMKMAALTDPHAPHFLRVNGPVSNTEAFYSTFGVKKGDKLYREPNKRAKIW